jgi:general secretion pathway protein G
MKIAAGSMVREFSGGGRILSRARKSALNQDPHLHPLPYRERRQTDDHRDGGCYLVRDAGFAARAVDVVKKEKMKSAPEVTAMKSRRYNQDGFTLIEIMVVILILGLLATIVVQSLRGAADKAKHTKAQADLAEIKTALDRYYLDNGYYPTTDQGLNALVTPPTNGRVPANYESGGYIERLPQDPWGTPYFYQSDGNSYVLKSFGADGVESADDIDASQTQ